MKRTINGLLHPVWFGTDYSLSDPEVQACSHIVMQHLEFDQSPHVMILSDEKLQSILKNRECATWMNTRLVEAVQLIPLHHNRHDFSNSVLGLLFREEYDLIFFKLSWSHL